MHLWEGGLAWCGVLEPQENEADVCGNHDDSPAWTAGSQVFEEGFPVGRGMAMVTGKTRAQERMSEVVRVKRDPHRLCCSNEISSGTECGEELIVMIAHSINGSSGRC